VERLRYPLAHFLDVNREGQISVLKARSKDLFQHGHRAPRRILLYLDRAPLADEQVDVNERIRRIAIGDALFSVPNRPALDALEVNSARRH